MDKLLAILEQNFDHIRKTAADDIALLDRMTAVAAEVRRLVLTSRIAKATDNVVQHGPMRGYRLSARSTWREADNCAKVLGLYEQEVQGLLATLARRRNVLVDLGGADGFYAVGTVVAGMFQQSHVYEAEASSRANILEHAQAAGVESRVVIREAADHRFARQLQEAGVDLADSVVLIDVEGAEFDILTTDCLRDLRASEVIVEIHDFMRGWNCVTDLQDFKRRAAEYFTIVELRIGPRDLSGIPLVADHWNDTDRWLLCSEGRAKLMSWLWLTPKA